MTEIKIRKDDIESDKDSKLGRLVAGIIAILKEDPNSAMRCYQSNHIVIKRNTVTYAGEEKFTVEDIDHPKNNPFLT